MFFQPSLFSAFVSHAALITFSSACLFQTLSISVSPFPIDASAALVLCHLTAFPEKEEDEGLYLINLSTGVAAGFKVLSSLALGVILISHLRHSSHISGGSAPQDTRSLTCPGGFPRCSETQARSRRFSRTSVRTRIACQHSPYSAKQC